MCAELRRCDIEALSEHLAYRVNGPIATSDYHNGEEHEYFGVMRVQSDVEIHGDLAKKRDLHTATWVQKIPKLCRTIRTIPLSSETYKKSATKRLAFQAEVYWTVKAAPLELLELEWRDLKRKRVHVAVLSARGVTLSRLNTRRLL